MPTREFSAHYQGLSCEALRERLLWLETVLEQSKVGVWQLHVPTGRLTISKHIADLLGLTWHEGLTIELQKALEIIHPDDQVKALKQFRHYSRGNVSTVELRFRVRFADGQWHWVRNRGSVVARDANGKAEWIVGSWFDVQDNVDADQRLRKIASTIPGFIYEFELYPDGHMCFPYASDGLLELAGISPVQVKHDANALFAIIHSDDLAMVQGSIAASAQKLTEWSCEYRIRIGDDIRWFTGYAIPERDDSTQVIRWYGQIVDTTADKELELELQEHKLTLEKAQEIGNIGYWRVNFTTGELHWSDEIFRILGIDKAAVTPTFDVFSRAIHPDDRERVSQSMQQARKSGVHDIEHRIIRPDGEIRWVHELAGFRHSSDHQVMIGTVRDVTEQKNYQDELERLNITDELTKVHNRRHFILKLDERVQQVTKQAKVCVAIIDIDHFKFIKTISGMHRAISCYKQWLNLYVNNFVRGMFLHALAGKSSP